MLVKNVGSKILASNTGSNSYHQYVYKQLICNLQFPYIIVEFNSYDFVGFVVCGGGNCSPRMLTVP